MTHLKRTLWLAAWGVWLWLGFGLSRELPRDLGPVCEADFGEGEEVIGFLSGDEAFVTSEYIDGKRVYRIRDVRSGQVAREWPEADRAFTLSFRGLSLRHRVWSGVIQANVDGEPDRFRPFILNLDSGRRLVVDVEVPLVGDPRFHPTHPWALFSGTLESSFKEATVVIDLTSGRLLFSWTAMEKGREHQRQANRAHFVGDDEIAILVHPTSDPLNSNFKQTWIEIWRVFGGTHPQRVYRNCPVETWSADGGRGAWLEGQVNNCVVKVMDLRTGTVVFQQACVGKTVPILSADGRTLLLDGKDLWGVDNSKLLHSFRSSEYADGLNEGRATFQVLEIWRWLLPEAIAFPLEGLSETIAVRDARTGRVIYRYWKPPEINSSIVSCHGDRFLIDGKHRICKLPPPPNYPLLAVCQTILALPLVLLWAVLRLRRKRRLRLASVAA